MNSLVSVSVWIALVTVIPGLITIATVFGAVTVVEPGYTSVLNITANDWVWGGVAVTSMILTQSTGILLEAVLVNREWLGPSEIPLTDEVLETGEFRSETVYPYAEYDGLYGLLVRIQDGEDPYGHLERAVAQFFLSNNTLVSFSAGILTSVGLLGLSIATHGINPEILVRAGLYLVGLLVALGITYYAVIARFHVMTLSAWALRTNPRRY